MVGEEKGKEESVGNSYFDPDLEQRRLHAVYRKIIWVLSQPTGRPPSPPEALSHQLCSPGLDAGIEVVREFDRYRVTLRNIPAVSY